jgi:hypothetical protein
MKTILPVMVWSNGMIEEAVIFDLQIIMDDLETTAQFLFIMYNNTLNNLASGNLTINGDEYINWDNDPSANEFAYNWAANQLGLTITGDYIKPE